jgi:hypothetical protein
MPILIPQLDPVLTDVSAKSPAAKVPGLGAKLKKLPAAYDAIAWRRLRIEDELKEHGSYTQDMLDTAYEEAIAELAEVAALEKLLGEIEKDAAKSPAGKAVASAAKKARAQFSVAAYKAELAADRDLLAGGVS